MQRNVCHMMYEYGKKSDHQYLDCAAIPPLQIWHNYGFGRLGKTAQISIQFSNAEIGIVIQTHLQY